MYTVYKHTTPSNKVYIGITSKDPEERWGPNGCHYKQNRYFWFAIEKYGWDNIQHDILFSNLTKDEAGRLEQELIKQYDCMQPKGYNGTTGGETGYDFPEHVRKKISNTLTGRKQTPEEIANRSAALKGHFVSEETKRKLSVAHTGKKMSDESIQKMREAKKGNVPWNKGKHGVQKAWNKGIPMTDEQRKKVSKRVKCVETGVIYDSLASASANTGVAHANISAVCLGKRKTTGGYHWEYADPDKENFKRRNSK